eukprot:m.215931 g.215931  ORF g.215931 m.215931 type:complete len:360 (+) comp15544_c0_seq11:42-1121(+)
MDWVHQCPCCDRVFRPRAQCRAATLTAIASHLKAKRKNGCEVHQAVCDATMRRRGCPACPARFDTAEDAWFHLVDASGEAEHDRYRTVAGAANGRAAVARQIEDPVRARERLLYAAAQNGEAEVVRQYLERGASPNNGGEDGWTPLMAAAARGLGMFAADHDGHARIVRLLAQHPACTTLNSKNRYGQTALSFAAQENHVQAVLELLELPEIELEATANSRLTAAETARRAGHDGIADLLAAAAKDRQVGVLLEALTTGCASGLMDSTSARIRALYHAADLDVPDDASNASTDTEPDIDGFDGFGAGCVVCLSAVVQVAFVPCFHAQACVRCAEEVREADGHCPVCRSQITGLQRIYLS